MSFLAPKTPTPTRPASTPIIANAATDPNLAAAGAGPQSLAGGGTVGLAKKALTSKAALIGGT